MESWAEIAMRPAIVRRAFRVALVVGTILVTINYADRVLAGSLMTIDYIKMVMTYCVPYCVATYSAVGAVRDGQSRVRAQS